MIAIALDDDQGAYLDNNTWPAPHWHAYIGWLRQTVASIVGTQSSALHQHLRDAACRARRRLGRGGIGIRATRIASAHTISPTSILRPDCCRRSAQLPVMQSEFQAGWFQTADEGAPRPSDPSNTAIALGELLRDGIHGIVNFPVQDTIDPHGWEAPWANWVYAWDAALTSDLRASTRYAPTRWFGDLIRAVWSAAGKTHVAADAAIVWPATLFAPGNFERRRFQSARRMRRLRCSGLATPAA